MCAKNFRQIFLVLLFLIIFTAILSACATAPASEAPAAPVEPEAPAEPVKPSEQYPVQYGQDSRTEWYQLSDSKLKEMAASVAIFVHSEQVKVSGNSITLDGNTLNEMSEMGRLVKGTQAPLCAAELFASQPAPGFCTGFLVKEDVIVTAGHCIQKVPCSDTSIVFGFYMESDNSLATISRENVYRCEKVISQVTPTQDNQYLDYAILKLDRPTGRPTLDYAIEDHLNAQNGVAVIGHPSGLPLKIASDAVVIRNGASEPFFVTNLDTFGSNSGSPVINAATYQVEGILVLGAKDYILSDDQSCIQVNRCPEGGGGDCVGENATKMSVVAASIPARTTTTPTGVFCISNLLLVIVTVIMMRIKSA